VVTYQAELGADPFSKQQLHQSAVEERVKLLYGFYLWKKIHFNFMSSEGLINFVIMKLHQKLLTQRLFMSQYQWSQ